MKKLLLLLITLVTLTNVSYASFPVSDTLKLKQNTVETETAETIASSSYVNSKPIVGQIFQVLGSLSLILSIVSLILMLTPIFPDGSIRRIPFVSFALIFGIIGLFKKRSRILSMTGILLSSIVVVIGMIHLYVWIDSY